MSENNFIPLNEYSSEEKSLLVSETMILEKGDEDGIYGKIIDRGLSYVPRVLRFKKGKRTMKKSLNRYIKKAKKVIDKFSNSFQLKVATIDPEYKELRKKVDKLTEEGKEVEAKAAMEGNLKELQDYKKDQMVILDKGIDDIFQAYTHAIDQRIDSPGFVLNVELSEKGKGELKAKWQELGAVAKMKIDEHKTQLIRSSGWKRLDNIISELSAFIETRKYAKVISDADFLIQNIKMDKGKFRIKTHLSMSGARLKVSSKGLIIGNDYENLEYGVSGNRVITYTGTYQYTLSGWDSKINPVDLELFIRPWFQIKEQKEIIYGDITQIKSAFDGRPDIEKMDLGGDWDKEDNEKDEEKEKED